MIRPTPSVTSRRPEGSEFCRVSTNTQRAPKRSKRFRESSSKPRQKPHTVNALLSSSRHDLKSSLRRKLSNFAFLSPSTIISSSPSRLRQSSRRPFNRFLLLGILSTALITFAALSYPSSAPTSDKDSPTINLTVVAPLDQPSNINADTPWAMVLPHIADRLKWSNPLFNLQIIDSTSADPDIHISSTNNNNLVVLLDMYSISQQLLDSSLLKLSKLVVPVGCSKSVIDSLKIVNSSIQLAGLSSSSSSSSSSVEAANELYNRQSSDDLLFALLILINNHITTVPEVNNSTTSQDAGLDTLVCMATKCGKQIFSCLLDPSCRTALTCLNSCKYNDQVCSYRCIASYESKALEDFSLCILTKHNCLGLEADIPVYPDPQAMTEFRGSAMTHEMAEDLFIGWLGTDVTGPAPLVVTNGNGNNNDNAIMQNKGELFSWKVFGGKNPAYDYFPCQFQLFYRGRARGSFWYDPVFMVKTLDGQQVWRRRHYRVRRHKTIPGKFIFSVLDNGVVSKEEWTVLDCADDLEWCVFYYNGAASAAGLIYRGAILTSRSGESPTDSGSLKRIEEALERGGIKMWEVSRVDNGSCGGAPLDPTLMAV